MTRSLLLATLLALPTGALAALVHIGLTATPDSPQMFQVVQLALEGDRLAIWLIWRWALEHYGAWISIGGSCWIAAFAWIATERPRWIGLKEHA